MITRDPFVLESIQGYKIHFSSKPVQNNHPCALRSTSVEEEAMTRIIADLQGTGVISESPFQEGDFMNNVFLREKSNSTEKDKKFRMILNVKDLNKHVLSQHFKMETLDTCIQMMHEKLLYGQVRFKGC